MKRTPNVVLVICDQLQVWATGCYGNNTVQTPAIDALAAGGARFQYAVSNAPVCMAARSVMMSGKYNRSCTGGGANVSYTGKPGDFAMPEYPDPGRPHLKDTTLAETLRAAGYHTAVIGKWHIHSWPHDVGFDSWLIPRVHHAHSAQLFTENGGPEFVAPGYSVDFEATRVERFLADRARRSEPFFLYYSISPPHCPVADIPEEYRTRYDPQRLPLRGNVKPDLSISDPERWYRIYRWDYRYYSHGLPYTQELPAGYGLRELTAEYYGAVTWMDAAVGRMLAALDRQGLADDTIVVFLSDHGDNLGSHGLVQKGTPNTESARIPLLVRYPGVVDAGQVVTGVTAGIVDLAPTLLSLAGLEAPAHLHGKDCAPWLRGSSGSADRAAGGQRWTFFETRRGAGVYDRHLVYFTRRNAADGTLAAGASWLADLRTDPLELTAAEGTSVSAADAARLRGLLEQWNENTPFGY